jgi:hypothetical protein
MHVNVDENTKEYIREERKPPRGDSLHSRSKAQEMDAHIPTTDGR